MTDTISDEVIQEILALDERFRHDVVRYANFSPNAEWNDALDSIVNAFHIETAMYFAHHNIDIFYKIPVAAAIIRQQQERIKELEALVGIQCGLPKQEPLGKEFQEVIDSNLSDILARR